MSMPHGEHIVVEASKLADYLLSPTSPRGKHKAAFFERFGYTIANMIQFEEALKEHGQTQQVTRIIDTPYGRRYYVEGPVRSPDGRNPLVRTVWQLEPGSENPRLLSAIPRRR